jgi:hypothetical protein
VVDETRAPVAIRSMRPYASEDAFLAEERDTLTRTAITLIGAPTRPRGVVIRFEVTLNDGTPILRGEGRVLGFQPADDRGPSSLTLRFTRLDAKSKALVDRAADLRDASDSSPVAPAARPFDTAPPPGEDPLASTTMGSTMSDSYGDSLEASPASEPIALAISSGNLPLGEAEEIGLPPAAVTPPPRRDLLLDQLRTRAKGLTPSQVAIILTPRSTS